MKIYTKTGDQGLTSLIGGVRVPKYHLRIESYGTIDELNSYIGLISSNKSFSSFQDILLEIQNNLFVIGAQLASDSQKSSAHLPRISELFVQHLETEIDIIEQNLPQLTSFILPRGSQTISYCHIARCVCRRAERLVVQLSEEYPIDNLIIKYLNRLSDFLFVLARNIAQMENIEECKWTPNKIT